MSAAYLNQLLEKTNDWDKDERYMATNDLCNELSKDIKIDETMERRICAAVLKQLGWRKIFINALYSLIIIFAYPHIQQTTSPMMFNRSL